MRSVPERVSCRERADQLGEPLVSRHDPDALPTPPTGQGGLGSAGSRRPAADLRESDRSATHFTAVVDCAPQQCPQPRGPLVVEGVERRGS